MLGVFQRSYSLLLMEPMGAFSVSDTPNWVSRSEKTNHIGFSVRPGV